jgi:hypothetical protein
MLVFWISSQPVAHNASSALASVGTRRRTNASIHPEGEMEKA